MNDHGTKYRILRLQRLLIEQPFTYTMNRLCERLQTSRATIVRDINEFRNIGYVVEHDERYRYGFRNQQPYLQLRDLLHFSDEDQIVLSQAIDQISPHSKRGERLKKKLASVYDFGKLGHAYLRRPYLNKLDLLLEAKTNKKSVVLKDYRSSNSNVIADREVEAFHPAPAEDLLHAFDKDKKELRQFRISRIKFVQVTDTPWAYEGRHRVVATDPFRIVNDDQVMIHLRMGVGAYNELIERFPLTATYIVPSGEQEFDLQCNVNAGFLGLTNFILGFHHQIIEIVSPERLNDHIQSEILKIRNKWGV